MHDKIITHSSIENAILLENFMSLSLINYRCIDGANIYIINKTYFTLDKEQ